MSSQLATDQIIRDTTYDGSFLLWPLVWPNNQSVTLNAADADIEHDIDPSLQPPQYGTCDIWAEGEAVGVRAPARARVLGAT